MSDLLSRIHPIPLCDEISEANQKRKSGLGDDSSTEDEDMVEF